MPLDIATLPALVLFFAAMMHASISDLLHRKIANWLVGGLALCFLPMGLALGLPVMTMVISIATAVAIFGVGFAFFCKGWIGGGDVKLAAVCVLWLGAAQLIPFLVVAAVFGGVLSLAFMGAARYARAQGLSHKADTIELPYGPALASAAVVLFGSSQWVTAIG